MSVDSDKQAIAALEQENKSLRDALARAQTSLRRRDETLSVLRANVKIVAQTARLWAWQSDMHGVYVWDVNRPTELGLDGVPMAELGARYFAMIDPTDLELLFANHQEALKARARFVNHRYRVAYPDGVIRHLEGRGALIYDANGEITCIVGVTLDVTSEVEAAEQLRLQAAELRDAQRRLERASLSSDEGHWDLDLATGNAWNSPSFFSLLGYAATYEGFRTRKSYLKHVHPEDWPREEATFTEHIEQGTPLVMEIRMLRADGEWRWIRLRGMAEFDEQRKPVRMSGSVQDIHQQKIAEDDLRSVRQRFERAIRGTQDGLWEWDLQNDSLWASPRYEALLGYEEGQLPGGIEHRISITHPDDVQRVIAANKAHFDHGVPLDIELRMRHVRGHYIWMRARADSERDAQGRPVRVAGSIQDVTEAREARDALIRATEAAQAANQAKGDFLANVSHEIRTPMNGVIGMTTLLLDTPLDRTQLEYAQTIRGSADSLLAIINDILDFSKIEAGKLDIENIELDLRRTVEDVNAMMSFQAQSKHLKLVVTVQPGVPRRMSGDPQRIRQCLLNLVGNAIKFTQSGEVQILVGVTGRKDGKVLTRFEVRDTGIGISQETAELLFQPFVQADSSTTRHFGGTGLGLSIVRRLVEMMGGEVGIESVVGKGSTFWFTLPLATDVSSSHGARQPVSNPLGDGAARRYEWNVLVVEDNAVNQKVAQRFLERLGCRVVVADNGEKAVTAFAHGHFDLVLMDLQMPVMDGYASTREIRAAEKVGTRIPIVALTANAMAGQLERCLAADMDGLLTKPLSVERLRETLDRIHPVDAVRASIAQ